MKGKIIGFLREYIVVLNIITTIVGLFLFFMGVIWFWFKDVDLGFYTDIIYNLENWNAYVLVAGFIIFPIGLYYLYVYYKNRKFVLDEIKTNKRSELLKRHNELRSKVKRLPTKYQKMLKEKEDELNIK